LIIIRQINKDYEDLVELNHLKQQNNLFELEVPEYIRRNPILMTHIEKVHEYVLKYSHEFGKSMIAPPSPEELGLENDSNQIEKTIDEYRKNEVQKMIDESNEEYKALSISGDIVKEVPRGEKDPRLIEKVNLMGDILHIIEDKEKEKKKKDKLKLASRYASDLNKNKPQESKMLMKELTKVLALNNRDPQKYNVKFWS